MDHKTIALEYFSRGYNCAQSVFCSHAKTDGTDEIQRLQLATAFGGGIAREGLLCGAAIGGILSISSVLGQYPGEPKSEQDRTHVKVRKFLKAFEDIHGSLNCREILDGIDLQTPEGQKVFKESGLRSRCETCVGESAKLVQKMLQEEHLQPAQDQ